jgi:hypothetical protein
VVTKTAGKEKNDQSPGGKMKMGSRLLWNWDEGGSKSAQVGQKTQADAHDIE